jgi:hypothetical protein
MEGVSATMMPSMKFCTVSLPGRIFLKKIDFAYDSFKRVFIDCDSAP